METLIPLINRENALKIWSVIGRGCVKKEDAIVKQDMNKK